MRHFVLIGVPTYGTVSIEWALHMQHLQTPLGASASQYPLRVAEMPGHDPGEKLSAARNQIIQYAIDNNVRWIFFVDDDVIVPPEAFLRLHLTARFRNVPMVTGVYWSKTIPPQPLMWQGHMAGPMYDWHFGDVVPLDWAGCGCLCINTDALRSVPKPWFSTDYSFSKDDLYPMARRTEDIYFFEKCKEHGLSLWCDTSVQCGHQDRSTGVVYHMPQEYDCSKSIAECVAAKAEAAGHKLMADVGCGTGDTYWLPPEEMADVSVIRMDIDPGCRPDQVCDARMLPDKDQQYDRVYSAHLLEHFGTKEVVKVLEELTRVTKVGGEVVTVVPDLEQAMRAILDSKEIADKPAGFKWWMLHGRQDNEYDFHKTGFIASTLKKAHEAVNDLDDVRVEVVAFNLVCRATKKAHTHRAPLPGSKTEDVSVAESNTIGETS